MSWGRAAKAPQCCCLPTLAGPQARTLLALGWRCRVPRRGDSGSQQQQPPADLSASLVYQGLPRGPGQGGAVLMGLT